MVSLAKSANVSPESPPRHSINFSRGPSPHTMSPVSPMATTAGTVTPATYKPTGSSASGASTPATYHTATAHRYSSQSTNTNNPVSPPTSSTAYYSYAPSPNLSRNSLVNQHPHHQQQNQHPLSPAVSRASLISQASRMAISPPSATNAAAPPATPAKDVNRRGSRGTLSGMSPTVQALYGQHERDWRRSQNVLPEELVARGLDEGVFAGLR
jgi:hypothetical protein